MDWQQVREALPWLVVLIVVLAFVWKEHREHSNMLTVFAAALHDARNDPVALANAKAVAESVPQETFNATYDLINSLLDFVSGTPAGDLLGEAKKDLESIDHDPLNDPAPDLPPAQPPSV